MGVAQGKGVSIMVVVKDDYGMESFKITGSLCMEAKLGLQSLNFSWSIDLRFQVWIM